MLRFEVDRSWDFVRLNILCQPDLSHKESGILLGIFSGVMVKMF